MVKLIRSGLRKDRAILLIFLLIIILSTLLMHTGLMASDYKKLYEQQAAETGVTDYIVYTLGSAGKAEEWFGSADHVQSFRQSEVVFFRSLEISSDKFAKDKTVTNWMFEKTGEDNGYSELRFIERDDNVGGRKIYLNLYTAYSCGLCAGDRITADIGAKKYEFTVAGIYQHLFMGSSYTYSSVMVEPDVFDEINEARGALTNEGEDISWNNMFTVRVKEGYGTSECLKETKDALTSDHGIICDGYTTDHDAKPIYIAVVNILAGFMGAFAAVIMAICLIIIVFTINNNISRDVTNIGALKAVGHTVGQIRAALTAEYLLLGFIGSVAGIALSYALYPVLEYLCIRQITGIIWENRFFPEKSFGVLAGVLAAIVVTAFLSTIKIRSLHPATALRFGLQSNSFKKNHLPLDETKGGLNFLLAVKSALQNKAQNVIIFCIVLSVTFVTMFSGVLYYNTQVDISS
ncbi:MAG: FtsX-like permease family protein, partial [Ruminococcus sp.]|nr:FtsX-like permease family protein [Ruminococcus sp.]